MQDKRLGAGLIDGRAIWADQGEAAAMLAALRARLAQGQRICLQTSTPLQHVPYDKRSEEGHLPSTLLDRIAFATQKVQVGWLLSTAGAPHDALLCFHGCAWGTPVPWALIARAPAVPVAGAFLPIKRQGTPQHVPFCALLPVKHAKLQMVQPRGSWCIA